MWASETNLRRTEAYLKGWVPAALARSIVGRKVATNEIQLVDVEQVVHEERGDNPKALAPKKQIPSIAFLAGMARLPK